MQIESSRPACRYFLRGECRYSAEDCPFLHPENWEDIEKCSKGKRCKRGKSCGYRHCDRTGKIQIKQRKLNPLPNKAMMEKDREIKSLKEKVQRLEQKLAQTKRPETDIPRDLSIAVKFKKEGKQKVSRSNETQKKWIKVVAKSAKKEKGHCSGQTRDIKDQKEKYKNRFSHLNDDDHTPTKIQEPIAEETKSSGEEEALPAEREEQLASGKIESAEEDKRPSKKESGEARNKKKSDEAARPSNVDQTCPEKTNFPSDVDQTIAIGWKFPQTTHKPIWISSSTNKYDFFGNPTK